MTPFALWPLAASASGVGASFGPWQLLTYAFLHGSLIHLVFNMFALYMFGGAIEQVFGPRRYLIYYLVCVVSAAVSQLIVSAVMGGVYPTIGASGGVFGLAARIRRYTFRTAGRCCCFHPIPMPARVFVVVYAVIELTWASTGTQAGVAHFAHLGGMIGGFIMLRYWRSSATIRRRDPRL